MEDKNKQLKERLEKNYQDYRSNLLLYDRQELIDRAGEIADTANIFQRLTERSYYPGEQDYLLQFQNPLEVVVDHFRAYEVSLDAIDGVVADITDRQDDLSDYPLMKDAPVERPTPMRKFMDVDINSALRQLMEQKTAHYKTDLNYARDAMRKGAASEDPEGRNFVVIFRENGVECLKECDIFIADCRDYNTLQYFDSMTREPVLTYSVEITGMKDGKLHGNLYQQDNHALAAIARRAASPYTDVSIQFVNGREAHIPRKEYEQRLHDSLAYEYGAQVMTVRCEPEDESVVKWAVQCEHQRREKLPKGKFPAHVKKLEDQRIQAEAERLAAELQTLTEPNNADKTFCAAKIDSGFIILSEQRHMDELFVRLKKLLPEKGLFVDYSQREKNEYSIGFHPEAVSVEKKPSVREQLSIKPAQEELSPSRRDGHQNREKP